MARKTIGLDIGTRAVRLAEVHASGEPTLSAFGRLLLPSGAVERGEVRDPQAVGEAISTLRKRLGLKGRSVHVGMANRRVVVRTIELPVVSPEDLDGAIRYQAAEQLPIPLEQAVLDYEVIDESTEDGKMRVLAVAAERAALEPLIAAVSAAGLEVVSLELNVYPLARALADASSGTEAVVDVGAGVTSIVVAREGKVRFARVLANLGGDDFTRAIEQSLDVTYAEAEGLKRAIEYPSAPRPNSGKATQVETKSPSRRLRSRQAALVAAPGATSGLDQAESAREDDHADHAYENQSVEEEYADEPLDAGGQERDAVLEAVKPVTDRFTSEIRNSVDFYSAQSGGSSLDRVIVTGGGSLINGFVEDLAASLRVGVERGRPFRNVRVGKVKVSDEEKRVAEPFMGVAVGLALAGARR